MKEDVEDAFGKQPEVDSVLAERLDALLATPVSSDEELDARLDAFFAGSDPDVMNSPRMQAILKRRAAEDRRESERDKSPL